MVIHSEATLVQDWAVLANSSAHFMRCKEQSDRIDDLDLNQIVESVPRLVQDMAELMRIHEPHESVARLLAENPQFVVEENFLELHRQNLMGRLFDDFRDFVNAYNNEIHRLNRLVPQEPDIREAPRR